MLVLIIALFVLILLATLAGWECEEIPVFVIAGQSNAVGYGTTWQEVPVEPDHPRDDTMFWYLQGSPLHPRASNSWIPLSGEEHRSLPMLGSELTIGHIAASELKSRIAIIKVAFNGTALDQTVYLDWNVHSGNELFTRLVNETRRALAHMPTGTKGRLAGFFWIQGESDAMSSNAQPNMSLRYRCNLETLIDKFRQRFKNSKLPIVIARIAVPETDARSRHFGYRGTIREAQEAVAEADPRIASISTDDLPRQTDELHFTAQGQLEMGRRFIAAWLRLIRDIKLY